MVKALTLLLLLIHLFIQQLCIERLAKSEAQCWALGVQRRSGSWFRALTSSWGRGTQRKPGLSDAGAQRDHNFCDHTKRVLSVYIYQTLCLTVNTLSLNESSKQAREKDATCIPML